MRITEQRLEDLLCHMETIMLPSGEHLEIIERQVRLPHGILDLLAWGTFQTYAIELKRGPIRGHDVAQVLRYVNDIRMALLMRHSHDRPPIGCDEAFLDWLWLHNALDPVTHKEYAIFENPVRGILMGRVANQNVLAACKAANIDVYLWRWRGGEIELASADTGAFFLSHFASNYEQQSCFDSLDERIMGCCMQREGE